MDVLTGYQLAAIAKKVDIAEDDLWKYLNRAIALGQVDQFYITQEAAESGDDYDSEYEFKKYSAKEFLALIPTTD